MCGPCRRPAKQASKRWLRPASARPAVRVCDKRQVTRVTQSLPRAPGESCRAPAGSFSSSGGRGGLGAAAAPRAPGSPGEVRVVRPTRDPGAERGRDEPGAGQASAAG